MSTTDSVSRFHTWNFWWLLFSQLLAISLLVFFLSWVMVLILSSGTLTIVAGFVCVPFLILLGFAIAAWVAFFRGKDKIAFILTGLCLLTSALLFFVANSFSPPLMIHP